MDFLNHYDCDVIPKYKKSHRVRSWYLYEQFKSLEHNQLGAARKLKDRSYQDRILRQELSERKARRILYDQGGLGQSESGIECVGSESTRVSFNTDDFFENFQELDDEGLAKGVSPDLQGACSQDKLQNGNFYEDDFKSAGEPSNDYSYAESVVSVVNAKSSETVTENFKNLLESEKEAKLEDLDLNLDDVNEKLECFERLAKLRNFDNFSDNEDLHSMEDKKIKQKRIRDKILNTPDNNINIMWTKLVTFAYQIMESNHGNFYYDYGSQLLTAVLACDVLRRGINRMCHILQPYVSPIKFAADSESSLQSYKNVKRKKPQRSEKFRKRHYKRFVPNNSISKTRLESFVNKRYHPENWEQHSLPCFIENENNTKYWQTSKGNPPSKSSYYRYWPLCFSDNMKKDLGEVACSCCCHKVVNPMLRLSVYLDRIMRDIDNPI